MEDIKTIGTSDMDLKIVLDEFEKMNCKQINHLIGNHELYNYKRKDLKKLLNTTNGVNGQTTWYSYRPVEKVPFRVIVLDTYDISYIEGTTNERTEEAKAILAKYNPNDFSKKGVNWVSGLKGKIDDIYHTMVVFQKHNWIFLMKHVKKQMK